MIPPLNAAGELPPGIHLTTLEQVSAVFARTQQRRRLFEGLKMALLNLKSANVRRAYIDGSFVTSKTAPLDVDGCWEWHQGVDLNRLDPHFLDFSNQRQAMRNKYGVDFFIADWEEAGSGMTFLQFFQRNRSDEPRGILAIDLEHMP